MRAGWLCKPTAPEMSGHSAAHDQWTMAAYVTAQPESPSKILPKTTE